VLVVIGISGPLRRRIVSLVRRSPGPADVLVAQVAEPVETDPARLNLRLPLGVPRQVLEGTEGNRVSDKDA
jgi:hypothetical protein